MYRVSAVEYSGSRTLRWIHGMRYREGPFLDHSRLRWYRDVTMTYRLTARCIVPASLRLLARVTVEGLENVPLTGPVILAANHRDNLDGFLLLHLVPRSVHVAARANGFGTGSLCAVWRRLGAFPADAWGMRYTEAVHASSLFTRRANVRARFGTPVTFTQCDLRTPRSRVVTHEILQHIGALLPDER